KRTATVHAIRDTMVAKLSVESFNRLLQKHPRELVTHFAGSVIKRLWLQTLGSVRNPNNVVNIALVPTGNHVPLLEFSRRLAECLKEHAPTLHLNSDSLDQFLSPKGMAQTPAGDPDNVNVVRWLNHQETKYRYLLYQTDAEPSEWTLRCLRQADRVVLVGDTLSSPRKGVIEETLLTDSRYRELPKSLVILHRQKDLLYDRTGDWLRERVVQYHYHVCPDDADDMARLARLLSGKGVGLVLSGGGARGFAHIGAIRALREAGVPIDKVGGSSMGSIVAGMAALRWDYETMMEQACGFNYRMDYTFPAVALTSGKSITRQLKERFGEQKIEDLWINFFCVSTDLNSSLQRVHDQGLLWKYIRASMSIPGLFPPVIEGNRFLVDGAVFNNIPVDVMRKLDDVGPLIAFDVGAPMGLETETAIEGNFSGWQALIQKFGPAARTPALPSVTKTLIASWLIKSDEALESMKNLADYYVRFPVQDFGLLDFDQVKQIAQRGYSYAHEKLAEWRREGLSELPGLKATDS
ncbi:MAG: patatin-like phospholipase family protein, partial [Methylococcaceae bacterium]|nr:patatin-like phospholipase family protein [Methylococcaceae bacterium]